MSTIITPSEEQINIVVNDEKISINVESGDVIVNVNEQIVEVSTVNGGYPLPTTVYSVFGRTGNIIAVDGDYDLGELGDVTLVSSTNGDVLTYDGTKWINKAVTGTGTVTSVNMSVPVGLQVSGNPITVAGTLAVNFAAGYSLPTTAKQTTWDAAYNDSIVSASVSGTTTKTLTLTQQDGGTITASWTDIDTNLVTSVNGYVGTVVLTTSDIAEGSRLYYTETRVSNNVDVAANTAARHSAVTIGTANGLSLASQVLSLALASASTTGALSSTDWATFNNKVPYSGATGNVTLGEYQLSAGQIAFDQSPTGTAGVGILRWNDSDGTLDLGLKGGNVTLQVGQEMVARVVNKTGADLLESGYKVVRISSAQGQRLAVQLAQANNDTNSTDTIGIVTETIVNNQEGFITILGQVKEINTTGSLQGETWADGDVLYLSPTTAGNITNIKPIAPSHMVVVGYVEYAHSQHGKIYCKTQNGYELEELHDCYLPTYVSNGVLYRDTTNNLWKNASIATVLGYTPISLTSLSGVSPLSYNNTTGAFSIAQATTSANGYLSSTDWNTFNGKQAALNGTGFVKATGTTISYDNSTYYLASNPSAYIALTGLSATAPLSYNNTTGGFTISQAGVSGNGYLSSTDWNTFNNKQASGNYITALSGEATASGPGSAAVTLSTSAVTGKLLTGVNITGGSITATDSILVAFGKVQNQINGVLGGAIYQSVWNASTNSPTLTSGTGTKGYYYIVSVAGSTNLDGITDWKIGDWAIFNGTTWNKVDNSDAVSSVNGFTGAVSLTSANISEVTNLYYTEGRVSANTDVAANTAARHAAVTLGTANGLSLSTQALSLGLASTSATGALSSTDWNTFNLKQSALSGTGFVKISGSTISYDNSTYALDSDVVKLTGNQTIGSTKTFSLATKNNSGILLSDTSSTSAPSGYISLAGYNYTTSRGLLINLASQSYLFLFNTAAGNSYTFPNATGTLALTSDLTGGTVTSVAALTIGTSGTDLSSTVANSTTTPVITLNVPTASATNRGALSSADWTTFNNKQSALTNPVLASGTWTSGYLPKINGTYTIGNSIIQDATTYIDVAGYAFFRRGGKYVILNPNYNIANVYAELVSEEAMALSLSANGQTQHLYINTSGNISIGNTNNTYKLDVSGTGRYYSNSGSAGNATGVRIEQAGAGDSAISFLLTGVREWLVGVDNSDGDAFKINNITGSSDFNNVGLAIASTGAATFSSSVTATIFDSTSNAFRFNGSNALSLVTLNSQNVVKINAAGYWGTQLVGANDKGILIDNTGNVGIGTSSPIAALTVSAIPSTNGDSVYQIVPFDTNTATSRVGAGISFGGYYNGTTDYTSAFASIKGFKENLTNNDYAGALAFMTRVNGGASTERMRITSGGNVGIGTSFVISSYLAGSQTSGVLQVATNVAKTATANSYPVGFFGSNDATYPLGLYIGILTGSGTSTRQVKLQGTEIGVSANAIVMQNDGGNVIIGTTSDNGNKLQVLGTGTFSSTVTASAFYESSDSRLKTLIQDNYQTKGIASITPKLYTKNGKVELGYYAQDFIGILDSAVSKGSDDMLSLSYREVLVAKVYALEQRIKELEVKKFNISTTKLK